MPWPAIFLFAAVAQGSNPEPPPIGTRIPSPIAENQVADASKRGAFIIVQKMGACLVKRDIRSSAALLMTVPGSSIGHAALDKLRPRFSRCLESAAAGTNLYGTLKLQMKDSLLRGAIGEALYRLQFSGRPLSNGAATVSVRPILPPTEAFPEDRDLAITYAFAECLTQAQPATVRRLVLSKIGSGEEQAALAQLKGSMAPCVVMGTTLKTDRNSFRLMLAESLYRWSIAAVRPTAQEVTH